MRMTKIGNRFLWDRILLVAKCEAGKSLWPPRKNRRKTLEVVNKLMKKIIGLIAICLATTFTALPAMAQTTPQQPAATTQDPQCTPENKLAWYNEFRANFKTDTAKANELAKKWLACPQVAGEEQITPYLKNFVTLY